MGLRRNIMEWIKKHWNYNKDNEESEFYKEAYELGTMMTIDELRIRTLYSAILPPAGQPYLNRWLAMQRGYGKAALERFNRWEFAHFKETEEKDKSKNGINKQEAHMEKELWFR